MNGFYSFLHGNMILSLVFILLVCMSIYSWNITLQKIFFIKNERKNLRDFHATYMQNPNLLLSSLKVKHNGYVQDIVNDINNLENIVLDLSNADAKDVLLTHLSQTLDITRVKIDSGLTSLASIASSAPFIGLFGTVFGIYGTLIDVASKGSTGLSVVAAPMGEALVATAAGLFAAIPAVLAYNACIRYNRLIMQDLRHISEQFIVYYANNKI